MKILITNHWLKKLGGSETFTYTLGKELQRQGHTVHFYTNVTGLVSNKLKALGIPQQLDDSYDLILANHNTTVTAVYGRGPIVQTVHGTTPKLEQPSYKADLYVAISDEIRTYLKEKYLIDSRIIYNGIDTNRYRPMFPIGQSCKTVLSLCHSDTANQVIYEACKLLGIKLKVINKYKAQVWDMPQNINEVDLVISLGRGAYEAFACGRPVIIFDARPYMPSFADGYVNNKNIHHFITSNCSGRYMKLNFNAFDLAAEIKKYNPQDGAYLRNYATAMLNIETNVKEYISLIKYLK